MGGSSQPLSSFLVMGRSPLVSHQTKEGDRASCRGAVRTEGLAHVLSAECVWAAVLEPAASRADPKAEDCVCACACVSCFGMWVLYHWSHLGSRGLLSPLLRKICSLISAYS